MDIGFNEIMSQDQNEEKILEMIEQRVAELLDTEPELLMSYLYRLDVLEKDLKLAMKLNASNSLASVFSKLIWERQKKRILLRQQFKQDPIEGWEY